MVDLARCSHGIEGLEDFVNDVAVLDETYRFACGSGKAADQLEAQNIDVPGDGLRNGVGVLLI